MLDTCAHEGQKGPSWELNLGPLKDSEQCQLLSHFYQPETGMLNNNKKILMYVHIGTQVSKEARVVG